MGFHDYTAILGSPDLVVLFVMPILGNFFWRVPRML
jgi:hypothetical protein